MPTRPLKSPPGQVLIRRQTYPVPIDNGAVTRTQDFVQAVVEDVMIDLEASDEDVVGVFVTVEIRTRVR